MPATTYVIEPVLDLVGWQAPEPVFAEAREDVALEVASVRLLRRRRQPPGRRQELLGPVRQRNLASGWSIHVPRSRSTSISRTKRSPSALRVNVSWERVGARPGGSGGSGRSLTVCHGQTEIALTCYARSGVWRRRPESNRCTGLCSTVPGPSKVLVSRHF